MAKRFAAAVVRIRFVVVLGWIVLAVAGVQLLPSIEEAQTGSLGELVPLGAASIAAEERSAELFAFPFASRTVVVERSPDGLSGGRLARNARMLADVNRDRIPELRDTAGAYGITNAIPGLPFARERGTTAVTGLLFGTDLGVSARTRRGERYADLLDAPSWNYVGVTGSIPARRAQALVVKERLRVVELATVLIVMLSVGLFLRSFVAPLVTVVVVAVAYLLAVRTIAGLGEAIAVSVPAEVEPVLIALLFGIVTDYAIFFMSRFRALVAGGVSGVEAARRTTAELTPIVLTCGLAVAAGSAALVVADLGFLRAFGPGMAMAVLVALLVVLTMLPALMAIFGARLFWPSSPERRSAEIKGRSRATRAIALAVRRPKLTLAWSLAVVAAMSSGVLWLELGNPQIRGLPDDNPVKVAYGQIAEGFAPGVVAPVTMIVEGEGITGKRAELASLQSVLSDQAGIAGVIGPGTSPAEQEFGAVLSRTGDAARFLLIDETDPLGADAIRRLQNLRQRAGDLAQAVGLEPTRISFAGDTALAGETIELTNDDAGAVIPAVLVAIALVLVVFLRSLVAPLYLVLLAALAPLAALGLAVGLFQGLLGETELTFFVPIVAAVLLTSLGSDYNVFIVGSIWAEARRRPLREAIVTGGSGAAHAIAAAGLVLAASFAALGLVPVRAFQELAFVLSAGLLIDAFLIRLVIAPAVIVIAERRRSATLKG